MSDDTKQIDDGGPAFPSKISSENAYDYICDGMTLRDYFAGQALAQLVQPLGAGRSNNDFAVGTAAYTAYRYADAMLAARKSQPREEKP